MRGGEEVLLNDELGEQGVFLKEIEVLLVADTGESAARRCGDGDVSLEDDDLSA